MRVVRLDGVFRGLVEDRYVVAGTRVVDVREPDIRTVLDLDGARWARAGGGAVLARTERGLDRWARDGDRWRATPLPFAPDEPRFAVSTTGRYAFVDARPGALVDLETGATLAEVTPRLPSARPAFDRLPDGREVLFVAAPSYMAVRMLDCATGAELHAFEPANAWDFCHTDFRLVREATRLVTFGCIWAGPYEARVYDATPWTRGAAPADGFPLPLVRRIEPLAWDLLMPVDVAADGALTVADLETRAELGPDEDGDLPGVFEAFCAEEPDLAAALDAQRGDAPCVLLVRALDPDSLRTTSGCVAAVPRVPEQRILHLDGHRVVVAGPRLLVLDASTGVVDDRGALALPERGTVVATRDGEILVHVG